MILKRLNLNFVMTFTRQRRTAKKKFYNWERIYRRFYAIDPKTCEKRDFPTY